MRVGVETSISSVTHSSASVTATHKVYTQNQYTYSDNQTLSYTGSGGGQAATNYTNNDGSTAQLRATKTYTYNYTTYGSSPGTRTFTATVSGAYNGVTPSKSATWTIPARPYAAPAAPSALNTSRTSDTQAALTWTRNATDGEPYDSQSIVMKRIGYDLVFSAPATISGTATSVNVVTEANFRYRFYIRANNSIGSSAYVPQEDPDVINTPAAPLALTAEVVPGTGVVLTWDEQIRYSTDCFYWRIQRKEGAGAYATVVETLPGTMLTWTDSSPPAGALTYRIQAYTNTQAGIEGWEPADLGSAYTEAEQIADPVPPLAPTGLSPNGVAVDGDNDVVLTWVHNHGGDYSSQTRYQYRYSDDGGASWTTSADTASTASTATIAGGTLTNGDSYIWQVRTTGDAGEGYGPYSASATLAASSTPTVTLDPAIPGATTTDPSITVEWAYNQDEASAQVAWQARLYLGATLLESRSGTTEITTTYATVPVVGSTYTVQVRALSAAGLWSAWASTDTLMSLLPPADVTLTCSIYDDVNGTWSISVVGDAPEVGVTEEIESVSVERQVDGAGEWLPVAEPIDPDGTVVDPLPSTSGANSYRAVVLGVNGAYSIMDPITCSPQDCDWVRVNYGSRLTEVVRCDGAPEVGAETTRERATAHYLGRSWPALLVGDQLNQTITFKGTLHFDPDCDDCTPRAGATSTAAEWEAMSLAADVIMFRDNAGRRVLASLGAVQVSTSRPGIADLSLTMTVIDASLERVLTGFPDLSEGE